MLKIHSIVSYGKKLISGTAYVENSCSEIICIWKELFFD